MSRIALVTGSNKGIGLAVVRQLCQKNPSWIVYLTARDIGRGETSVKNLKAQGLNNVNFHQLDITSTASIRACAEFMKKQHGGLDVLVNNAAIIEAPGSFGEECRQILETNYFGTMNVCREFFPLLRDHARVVNVSSRDGHMCFARLKPTLQQAFMKSATIEDVDKLMTEFVQLAKDGGNQGKAGWSQWCNAPYESSKVGVSVASIIQQRILDEDKSRPDLVVNACCPGFVRTDMTNGGGYKETPEGADTLVYLAMLPDNCKEPRGRFVNEREINDIFDFLKKDFRHSPYH